MTTRFPTATELDRDRFVLSAGHASMLLYSLLYLAGYGLTLDDQRSFRHLGSPAAGHPERSLAPGIETTTGPLGRNLHFGIREHAMDAIVNGLTLHYLRAYGSTFLVFIDYMRGAIRLAALMGVPSIFVFTHDSIGLGEDGAGGSEVWARQSGCRASAPPAPRVRCTSTLGSRRNASLSPAAGR